MNHDFPCTRFEGHLYRIYRRFIFKPHLKRLGEGAFVSPYAILQYMQGISIGDRSCVGRGTLIQAIERYQAEVFTPSITIGDDVYIGNRCTISAATVITIGNGTTIGDHVYIGAGRHGYENPEEGVLSQPLVTYSIHIGPRSWIGYGSFISGDIEIGEHAIVAANSVVTKSVPAFTVVAGAPAKSIKQYDFAQAKWVPSQHG